MQYSIEVLGLSLVESFGFNPYVGYNTVHYDTEHKKIGILIVEADNEQRALIKAIKLCAEYYSIFSKNNSNSILATNSFDIRRNSMGLVNSQTKALEEIPDWLLYYFKQNYIRVSIPLDFQSLDFKILS